MRMPYWQFLLHIGLLSLTAHRVAAAVMLNASKAPMPIVVCYAMQAGFALFAAVAMWLRTPTQLASIVALAAASVVTSAVQAVVFGASAVPASIGQALVSIVLAALVMAALKYAAKHPDPSP